ncbi:MAG: helix-turn-helix transcriptional regulator [Vulcanimicrobiota bacterium]
MDPDEFQKKIGVIVHRRRKLLGLSQEGLAEACGLHRTHVGGIERGEHNLALKTLLAVATGLQVKLSVLIADAEA